MKKGISWLLKGKRKFVIVTFLVISVISGVVILKSIKSMNVASHTEKGGGRTVAAFEHCLTACVIKLSERDGRHDYAQCVDKCKDRDMTFTERFNRDIFGMRSRPRNCLNNCVETDEDEEKLEELRYECGELCD